ncbi:MAG: putative DNA binding domain-containing protein [Candidatus Marinimicrobia bacterium]|nr:putative DNA binding domain-containing protein [Candidatus Neomarinimicrobiota bacterium]
MNRRNRMPDESQTVEWKQSFGEWKEIVETCAAFATAEGGTIYVGISPAGKEVGVTIGKGSMEDLANKIKTNTDPAQFPSIEVKGDPSSALVEIHVTPEPIKPVWAFGRPVKRVGRTNQFLKRDEAQRLLEVSTGRTWDALPCEGFLRKDISLKAVRDFLRRADMPTDTPFQDVIRNLKLGDKRHVSHAAALLFSDFPQRFFVEAKVKCARFLAGSLTRFLDERTIDGPVLQQLDEAMAFVTRNTRQALVVTGKPQHDIVPEYPEAAVREAITNALCHRSYTDVGAIQVRIHDNCLEVWNPGILPPDLTIRSLYRRHGSYPRNPLLAGAIFRTRLIEQWGTGTLRIIDACRPHGIAVEFEQSEGMFIVRLKKAQAEQSAPEGTGEITGAESGVESGAESLSGRRQRAEQAGVHDGVHDGAHDGVHELRMTEVMQMILASINLPASTPDILKALGYPRRTRNYSAAMNSLLDAGLIEMTIPDKPRSRLQKYRLTEKGRRLLAQQGARAKENPHE